MSSTKSPSKRRAVKRPTPTRGLKASIFIEAARLLAQDEEMFCCRCLSWALGVPAGLQTSPEHRFLRAVLRPSYDGNAWYEAEPYLSNAQTDFARTLGLLLCAELVRDGFIPDGWTP